MKKFAQLIMVALAFAFAATGVRGELFQAVTVDIDTPKLIRVNRVFYPMTDLIAAIKKNVQGNDPLLVKIYVPGSIDRAALKKIMEQCRKAGAKSFFIVQKA